MSVDDDFKLNLELIIMRQFGVHPDYRGTNPAARHAAFCARQARKERQPGFVPPAPDPAPQNAPAQRQEADGPVYDVEWLAGLLGGEVYTQSDGRIAVKAPGPGHSPHDRSLNIVPDPHAANGDGFFGPRRLGSAKRLRQSGHRPGLPSTASSIIGMDIDLETLAHGPGTPHLGPWLPDQHPVVIDNTKERIDKRPRQIQQKSRFI
jgi:hypothetical protein